jgi:hypothetical protein
MYCVGNKRARVLGIDPTMKEGWPTAKTVVLKKGGNGISACTDLKVISDNDELFIDGVPPSFILHFKHNGKDLPPHPLTPANVPNNLFPMWYQTTGYDSDGLQYFIYMVDRTSASGVTKDQIYMLEAFSQNATSACLNEAPVFGSTVTAVTNATECDDSRFLENGTGTGAEPK